MIPKRLPFDQAEYDRRLLMTRMAMALAGLDALYVSDPSNMAWLTGYDGWSFHMHQGVIVLQDADPIWWGRDQDTHGALRTVWMPDTSIIGYVDDYVQSTEQHPMEDLARHLDGLGVQNLGIEMDNYYFSAKAFSVLLQALPNIGFADATGMVNLQRAIKSAPEIAFMRKAALISEKIMDGLIDRVKVGVPKNKVVAEAYHDAILGVDDAWGDYPAMPPMLSSGADWGAQHLTCDDRPFEAEEATFLKISGCYRRYHTPLGRTMFLGTPPDAMKQAEAALLEGLEAGINAARAGNRACDIANALALPLELAGIQGTARCGHSIGLSYPPDLSERTISLRANDESVLEPNMTFNFMPGLWVDNWGIEITESIRITEEGAAEVFCERPREIIVIS
ncbi:MAG: ectoine hydrolase [Ascidiaceihabitans sp.]|jgi:ectoine hydrolase